MANNFKHKDISQIFDMVRDRDHYTVIRDFFELSAISIRNTFNHGPEHANLEKRYMEIARGYKKEYLEGFAKALGLLGVPAVVRLGDALAMEYRQAWFTPAYLMAWPHFKRQIGRGNYPNSATVPKSPEPQEKPQESAPEPPKEETQELAPSMAETAPNCDENGQFSLF